MVGSPASGKSTWIEKSGLSRYTISPDNLRMLVSNPDYGTDGFIRISQAHDKEAWGILDTVLEDRMKRGEFTVIDATHTREKYLRRYKKLADQYRFRMYVKVMGRDLTLDDLKARNLSREVFKQVPEEVLELHHERMKILKIPSGVQEITQVSEMNEIVRYHPTDKPVYFIGDIHGTIDPLNRFLDQHFDTENAMFVFVGDYIDRGKENAEVLRRLFDLQKANNTIFLEGNHERWLWNWANGDLEKIRSREFLINTIKQLEGVIDKKEAREFYRKLRTFASFNVMGVNIFACHGGVSSFYPDYISTEQLINGVGKYEDLPALYKTLEENVFNNFFMVHGHRNVQEYPVKAAKNVFNLDGNVEMGGSLRVVRFNTDGTQDVFEYKNENYVPPVKLDEPEAGATDNVLAIHSLQQSKFVRMRECSEDKRIVSFNFTNQAFYKKMWDKTTIKARGLFVDMQTQQVVARSYNKFFNLNENEQTSESEIIKKVRFPVVAWEKENGFLGIVGYDPQNDEVLYCSKSTTNGEFAQMFKENLLKVTDEATIKSIVKQGKSLVFECVDMERDPHIIEYNNSFVCLLDVINNSFEYVKASDEERLEIAMKLGVVQKKKIRILNSIAELMQFHQEARESTNEGVVMEDANGYMWKIKADFYAKWKQLRSLKDRVFKQEFKITDAIFDPEAIAFLNWCKTKPEEEIKSKNIIELRNQFNNEKQM